MRESLPSSDYIYIDELLDDSKDIACTKDEIFFFIVLDLCSCIFIMKNLLADFNLDGFIVAYSYNGSNLCLFLCCLRNKETSCCLSLSFLSLKKNSVSKWNNLPFLYLLYLVFFCSCLFNTIENITT